MYKLEILNPDGSVYWTEHFNDEASANAWLTEEQTRPYWNSEFTHTLSDVSEPIVTPNPVAIIVAGAMAFGSQLIQEIAAENISLGITQDGMSGVVRKALSEVVLALMTGSLYDAIDEIRAIPVEKKDPKYITDTRLLAAINKIETYLGQPLSTSL